MYTNMLKAAMTAYGDTQEKLAEAIGISASNFSDKVNGKVSFRQSEIAAIKERYHLSADDVDRIFFGK